MRQIRTAAIATLGCKLNQSESDQMARQLAESGVEIVPFGQPADLCIVNSCTVTHVGDSKSRHLIRQAVRANPASFVTVTGCYAQLEPGAVLGIEGVSAVVGNTGKGRLLEALREQGLRFGRGDAETGRCGDAETGRGNDNLPLPLGDLTVASSVASRPDQGGRGEGRPRGENDRAAGDKPPPYGVSDSKGRPQGSGPSTQHPTHHPSPITHHSTPRTRAFLKIQEGCDNHCSYCIVPRARGEGHSVPQAEILREIRQRVDEGYQEIVLTGVNITAYGRDRDLSSAREAARGAGLVRLLESILEESDIARVRLSSFQPEDWSPRFYDLWGTGRLCRHLHLSLQSGSDGVLRRMRRRYNAGQYARIVEEAQHKVPGIAITTDVITGFPGETDAEHDETEAFLRSIGFAGLHVFKYSPRAGTPAAEMPDQVDAQVKQGRSERLLALADEMSRDFRSRFKGSVLSTLWEEVVPAPHARRLGLGLQDGRILWSGVSDNYVRVYAVGSGAMRGTISGASIEAVAPDGVLGTLVRNQG